MIEAVIFDMDGVLADTEYYYENRRKKFLLGNFIGSNEKAIWEAIVPNDPVRRQEMLMAYREYRKARPTPYGKLTDPQAEPLMNALRSRGHRAYKGSWPCNSPNILLWSAWSYGSSSHPRSIPKGVP